MSGVCWTTSQEHTTLLRFSSSELSIYRDGTLSTCRVTHLSHGSHPRHALHSGLSRHLLVHPTLFKYLNMDGQEAFRRLAKQLKATSGGPIPGGKGFFAGSGLLVALVGGGLILNASLFNGM